MCIHVEEKSLCVLQNKLDYCLKNVGEEKALFSTLSCSVSGSLQIKLTKHTLAREKKQTTEFIPKCNMRVPSDE